MDNCRVISIINMKGGVGKTTLAVNLGYALSKLHNKKVLILDTDPQMTSTIYLTNEKDCEKILKTGGNKGFEEIKENDEITLFSLLQHSSFSKEIGKYIKKVGSLDFVPSHLDIAEIQSSGDPFQLNSFIDYSKLREQYDFIFIDAPPTISEFTKMSLLASDGYLIPTTVHPFSIYGIELMQRYSRNLKRVYRWSGAIWYGTIFNKYPTSLTKNQQALIQNLKSKYPNTVFKSVIHNVTGVSTMQWNKTVSKRFIAENVKNNAYSDIVKLANEFLDKQNNIANQT